MLRYKFFACVALFLWLTAALTGMHGHICFDGKEPPISVHIDLVESHTESAEHQDVDVNLSPSVFLKLVKIDLPLLLAVFMLVLHITLVQHKILLPYTPIFPQRQPGLRPLLRAPPSLSA